ncbi:membrane-bound lytic murein transglycosylase MltF [soil metagenome]
MRTILVVIACLLLGTCSERLTLLEEVRATGELRVVTRNSPTTYYLGPQTPLGPEYELASRFAKYLGVELTIYPADRFADILPEVMSGRAHLAAAGLSVTEARRALVDFGPPYQEVVQHVVYRLGSGRPRKVSQIIGGHIEVVGSSSHVETLQSLRARYPGLAWVENPVAESEELLYRVAAQEIDYTIADSTEFSISRNFHPEIRVAFDLKDSEFLAWAFRADDDDDSLRRAAHRFFAKLESSGALERILERYYGHVGEFDYVGTRAFLRHVETRLPQYRHMFEEAAAATGIDWRLLAAIGYQESHWNPKAISPTGVRGIMMLTLATAHQVGIDNRIDPHASIMGGARYFKAIKARIPEQIEDPQRTWLALAAYNVGYWHLQDARQLAELREQDPDSWADVKQSLPLLSQKKWYSQVKYGYARGWEPVRYVDNVRSYFDILLWITSDKAPTEDVVADST